MKINYKKICALMLAGGIALSGSPKNVRAEDLTVDEIVEMCESNINRKMTYEDYCVLCYNAWNSLKELGFNVSVEELYSAVYLANFTYMSDEVKDKIKDMGFVSSNPSELMVGSHNIVGMMATYNDNLFIKSLEDKQLVDYYKMAHSSSLFFNQKDKDISDNFDSLMVDYVNGGKVDCELLTELYTGFTRIPNKSEYNLEQASIGAEYLINQNCGWVFYFHVSPSHPVNGNAILDDVSLNALISFLGDASGVVNALGYKCKTK